MFHQSSEDLSACRPLLCVLCSACEWHAEAAVEVTFLRGSRVGQTLALGNDRGARGAYSPYSLVPRAGPPRAVETSPRSDQDPRCFNGIIIALLAGKKTQHKHFRTRQHPEATELFADRRPRADKSPLHRTDTEQQEEGDLQAAIIPLAKLATAMTSTTDFDNAEISQQYSRINTRFDITDEEIDNDNCSARLFERSRIKALAAAFLRGKNRGPHRGCFRKALDTREVNGKVEKHKFSSVEKGIMGNTGNLKEEGEVLPQREEPIPAVNGVYLYVNVLDLYELAEPPCRLRVEARHHHGSSEERVRKKERRRKEGGREGGRE
ncbi:hypothetical protein NQZ68_034805 [Dissostichus eleginoides]|nr:hypothetical protein NQZ68_034805 [Dissostichus eleginoides]